LALKNRDHFIIGSRGSKLALWQAEWVRTRLEALHPGADVRIEIIKTSGDALRDVPLAVIGGRGVFTKELEEALLDGRIDVAVHSLKDLPTTIPEGLSLTAITEREDARDALVLREGFSIENLSVRGLPQGAVVGTSSPRRLAQLKHLRPDLNVKDLRGNVDTRLRKLDAGAYDAVILASAGLRRLGLTHRISAPVATEEMYRLVATLDHAPTRLACTAERALLRALGGGCQLPIAAHSSASESSLRLEGLVADPSGDPVIREALEGEASKAEQIGGKLAALLLERGADSLLAGSLK
jgi:hydroxymethylbilane synthase